MGDHRTQTTAGDGPRAAANATSPAARDGVSGADGTPRADGGGTPRPPRRPRRSREPGVLVAIACGGALGTPARYELSRAIHVAKDTFPWATFVTNVTGAFVLGVFLTIVIDRYPPTRYVRPFFAIGVVGSFTTFSTLAVEAALLVKDHDAVLGVAYVASSITAGLVSCVLGIALARVPRTHRSVTPRAASGGGQHAPRR